MNTKQPQNEIYRTYSEFLKDKEDSAKIAVKEIRESLKKSWFAPKSNPTTSSLDVKYIPEKFARTDCQAGYKNYLDGKKPPIEATTIKLQNGLLEAEEQAYRLRHLSIPRALSVSIMEPTKWSNGSLRYILIKNIQNISDLATEDYKNKFESR